MIYLQKQFRPEAMVTDIRLPMSITEALDALRERGYLYKFRREANSFYCIDPGIWLLPDDTVTDEHYHFEDSTNKHGDQMLYAISSKQGLKGFVIDTYYVHADSEAEYELQEEF